MNMSDIPERPLEPREPVIVGTCAACGDPIYAGSSYRQDDTYMLHDDPVCLAEWLKANWPVREICDALQIKNAAL